MRELNRDMLQRPAFVEEWPLLTASITNAPGVVDLTYLFAKTKASLFIDDIHLGPPGNKMVANQLVRLISDSQIFYDQSN